MIKPCYVIASVYGSTGAARLASAAVILSAAVAACAEQEGLTQPPPAMIASIEVTPAADTLSALGQSRHFTAVAKDADGNSLPGKTFTWSSSAPLVASVDPSSGLATAVGNGTATIVAVSDNKSGQASLWVIQVVSAVDVASPRDTLAALGDTVRFVAITKDSRGNPVQGKAVIWSSSDPSVATIDSLGLATARNDGTTTVMATVNNVFDSASLTVKQAGAALTIRTQPNGAAAGVPFTIQPIVEVVDAGGNVLANDNETMVTSTIASGGGVLLGNTAIAASRGLVSYEDLAIGGTVGSRTLHFSAQGLTAATSSPFDLSPGPPAQSITFATDSSFWWADSLPFSVSDSELIVSLGGITPAKDAYGNPIQLGAVIWTSWPAVMSRTSDGFHIQRREFVGWLHATDLGSETVDSVHLVAMHNLEGADFRETWTCVRATWWEPSDGDSVIALNTFDSLYYEPEDGRLTAPSRTLLARQIHRTSWRYFGTDSVTVFTDSFSPVLIGTQTVPDSLNHLTSPPGRPRRYVGVTLGCGESREMVMEEIP